MSTTCYIKFLRSGKIQAVASTHSEEEAVHAACRTNLRYAKMFGAGAEDVLAYAMNTETQLVSYWGTTFIDNPDHDPFYSVRTTPGTDVNTVRTWSYDDFIDHMEDVVGNFEP